MNKGTTYALACVGVMVVIIAVASVTLPHYETDKGPVHKYAVTNSGQTCGGDYQENLVNGVVYVDSDYDTPYTLSGADRKLPSFDATASVTFTIGSSTDISGVNFDQSTNEVDGSVTVTSVLIYSDSVTISSWEFKGAASVSCTQGSKGVFISVSLNTSCTYSVNSESSHGYFVIAHTNSKDYGGSDLTNFGVFTHVPSGDEIPKPDDMEFLIWMNSSSMATVTKYYVPGDKLTSSVELYALWGMKMDCTSRSFDGDDQEHLSDVKTRTWYGVEHSITELDTFAAPSDFTLTLSGGSECTDMTYSIDETMASGKLTYYVYVLFTYTDHEIWVWLTFNDLVSLSKTVGTNSIELEIVQKQGSDFSLAANCYHDNQFKLIGNGGTTAEGETECSVSDRTVPSCTFSCPGKMFSKWADAAVVADGVNTYYPGDSVSGDLTLYAIWEDAS